MYKNTIKYFSKRLEEFPNVEMLEKKQLISEFTDIVNIYETIPKDRVNFLSMSFVLSKLLNDPSICILHSKKNIDTNERYWNEIMKIKNNRDK